MPYLFEWDAEKAASNRRKHGIAFANAMKAFYDPFHVVTTDPKHSANENRFYCYGKVDGKIVTVRFTYRGKTIRIIGAAYWRGGKKIYAQKNRL